MTVHSRSESVLVVGGGVIGIACAHYLSEAGYKVTVIDRDAIGSGCSYANCGHLCGSHLLPLNSPDALIRGLKSFWIKDSPFTLKIRLQRDLLKWLVQFARHSTSERMFSLAAKLRPLLDLAMREYQSIFSLFETDNQNLGLLYVYDSAKEAEGFNQINEELAQRFGVEAEFMSGDQLTSYDPGFKAGLAGAFHYKDDTQVDPGRLLVDWRSYLEQKNVSFVEQCELIGIEKKQHRVASVKTTRGVMEADHYVIATGAWTSQLSTLLSTQLPIQPGKGYSLTWQKDPNHPKTPAYFLEKGVGITSFKTDFRVGALMDIVGFNVGLSERRLQYMLDAISPYIETDSPKLSQCKQWLGFRPLTSDSLPIIGRVSGLDNMVLATGHHMLGMTLAPSTGKLVAEAISESVHTVDIKPYSPERF